MATPDIEPRADTEGSIGTPSYRWGGIVISGDLSDGTAAVSPAEAADAYTHSQVTSGNPHSVTYTEVGADAAGTAASSMASHEGLYDHTQIGNASTIKGVAVSATAPNNGEALVYNSGNAQYEPTVISTLSSVTTDTTLTGDGTGGSPLAIANTAVTPGSYVLSSITVDQQGRITSAASGTAINDGTISGDGTAGSPLSVVNDGHTHTTATLSGFGTAALKDVPTLGVDATTAQVVMGDDSRLDDARDPNAHKTTHETGGSDPINHDSLTGFVALEHVSHTVTINNGTDFTGFGDISTSRSPALSATGVTAGTYELVSLTVDSKGRITSASSGGVTTDSTLTGDGTSGSALGLSTTGVVAATYGTNSFISLAVDSTGRVTDVSEITPTLQSVRLNIAPTPPTGEGYLYWDATDKTLNVTSDVADHVLQVGREMVVKVVNKTGVTLSNGEVVYISGAQGNRPSAALADADNSSAQNVLGIVTADILNNAEGYVTVFGTVKDYNTSGFTEGDALYLSSTAGALTKTAPTDTATPVVIAWALNSTANGSIFVAPRPPDSWNRIDTIQTATKEPTGFESPTDVTATYDSTTRVLTLAQTGGVVIWHQGTRFVKSSPVTVSAHSATPDNYFLTMDGTGTFNYSTTVWSLSDCLVFKVSYGNITGCTALPVQEHHGLMQWQTHRELHERIGTYVRSGATLTSGTYAVQPASPTDADNTPGIDAGVLADEDLPYTFDAWTQGTYTRGWADNTNALNLETGQTSIAKVTGTYPNYYTGAATTELANNQYANIYLLLMPTTNEAAAKNYRAIWLQPYAAYATLELAQAELFTSYPCISEINSKLVEYVPWVRVTIRTNAAYTTTGKFRISAVTYLSGSRVIASSGGAGSAVQSESLVIACSDETTDLTTGTAKVTFRMPFAMSVTDVRASVNTAPVGSTINVDINESGSSILSTVITIDASEKTSTTAATPPVISDASLADDAEITIDIDQVGSSTAGKGLKVVINGTRA